MKIVTLLLLAFALTLQTSDRFRSKYGVPISETYLVSSEILATVKYSKDGRPCSATVNPQSEAKANEKPKAISSELMRAIVNELVTPSDRGKLIGSGFLNLTCVDCESFYGVSEHYEKLDIRIGHNGNGHESAFIEWAGVSCDR